MLNGDRPKAGEIHRVYARVWNDGDIPKDKVRVTFQAKYWGMGDNPLVEIGETFIDLPARGFAIARCEPDWEPPMDYYGNHVCIKVIVERQLYELNANNNYAEENLVDWYVEGSSPYTPIEFRFMVTNPLPRRTLITIIKRGLSAGWSVTVQPEIQFWLEPKESKECLATIRADETVPFEGDIISGTQNPYVGPIISLEAVASVRDTYVPFGGISNNMHTVRRVELLDPIIGDDPNGRGVVVSGTVQTFDQQPVTDVHVRLRVLEQPTQSTIYRRFSTHTDGEGRFSQYIPSPQFGGRHRYLHVNVAPKVGTAPAETGFISFEFPKGGGTHPPL